MMKSPVVTREAARHARFRLEFEEAAQTEGSGARLIALLDAQDPMSLVLRSHQEIERLMLAMICVGHDERRHLLGGHRIPWLDQLRLIQVLGHYSGRCCKGLARLHSLRNDLAHGKSQDISEAHEKRIWNGIPGSLSREYRIRLQHLRGAHLDLEAPLARFRTGLLILWSEIARALVQARKRARSSKLDQRLGAARLPDLLFGDDKLDTANQAELRVLVDWLSGTSTSDASAEEQSPPNQSDNVPAPTEDPGPSP